MLKRRDFWPKETREQYHARQESYRTSPPTQQLGSWDRGDDVDYDYDTEVRWICSCGNQVFEVYYVEGAYCTFVICTACKHREDVHTG